MKRKLKIGVFVWSFPTTSETFIVNQICDLLDKGHELIIFAFRKGDGEIIHKNIKEHKLLDRCVFFEEYTPSKFFRYFEFLTFIFKHYQTLNFKKIHEIVNFRKYGKKALSLQNFLNYKWILSQGNFDVFHAHFGSNATYVAEMRRFGYYSKTQFVATFHGYDLAPDHMEENKKKYENLFKSVDLITVNTPYLLSLLKQVTNKTAKILPVGLNISSFKKINEEKSNNNFNILFVGRLIELKAAPLTVEILNELIKQGKKNVFLTIIGEGELEDAVLQKVNSLNLKEHVTLKGALPQQEVMKEMNKADVFLLPGIYDSMGRAETQGLVIQEAQAMELPVIVSDVGGMKYGLIDGETGFVVNEKDVKGFADKLELLISNPDLKLKMGKRGRKLVCENYDSKILGDQLEKIYYSF